MTNPNRGRVWVPPIIRGNKDDGGTAIISPIDTII